MNKIKLKHVKRLIEYINKNINENPEEPIVIFDTIFDICEVMELDFRLLEYINITDFMKKLYEYKLLQWEKISFAITDKWNIVFFKYLRMM